MPTPAPETTTPNIATPEPHTPEPHASEPDIPADTSPDAAEPLVREIDIEAAPETVFAFFVEPDKLTHWLATDATLDPRPGGACIQSHAGADRDAGPYEMHGEFLEVRPPSRVVFSWGFTDPSVGVPPGSSTVEVTLSATATGTHVRLVHHGLPAAETHNHADGWTIMLGRLATAVHEKERS